VDRLAARTRAFWIVGRLSRKVMFCFSSSAGILLALLITCFTCSTVCTLLQPSEVSYSWVSPAVPPVMTPDPDQVGGGDSAGGTAGLTQSRTLGRLQSRANRATRKARDQEARRMPALDEKQTSPCDSAAKRSRRRAFWPPNDPRPSAAC